MNNFYKTNMNVETETVVPLRPIFRAADNYATNDDNKYSSSLDIINLFTDVFEKFDNIENKAVKTQVAEAVNNLIFQLSMYEKYHEYRFHAFHISIDYDGSSLVEWNYGSKFRIGLSFEVNIKKSFYYIIENEDGNIKTETRKINGELKNTIKKLVQYVIERI